MQDLINMIYVEGNILLTMCNIFIFTFALDFVLSMCNILKAGSRSARS